jgi:hypothetical protein
MPVDLADETGMTNVVFIFGLCSTEADYKGNLEYVQKVWGERLPKGTPLHVTRWDRDVFAEIQAKFPTGDLAIVAFSFGFKRALVTCQQLAAVGRDVKRLINIDGVDYEWKANAPYIKGHALPDNVLSAWSICREAKRTPWSAFITSGKCEFINRKYNPKPVPANKIPAWAKTAQQKADYVEAVQHGEYVWEWETVNQLKPFL